MQESITTERLAIRRWQSCDAILLHEAIQSSIADLRRFTPWVIPDPPELATLTARLERFRMQFDTGESWIYGVYERAGTRVVGQVGLYARVGPDALELGYFIRTDAAGRGYATEAARALIDLAFSETDVARIELRCDPGNSASVAIAQRLGFHLRETLVENAGTPLMIYERGRAPAPHAITAAPSTTSA